MLFNSYYFILVFLPIVLIGFFKLAKNKTSFWQMCWIAFFSCLFYAYWKPIYLLVLFFSLSTNYVVAQRLMRNKNRWLFIAGILFNISIIVFFKYSSFLLENINSLAMTSFSIRKFSLPLGISFITFQKIAYLADVYQGRIKETNFLRYLVFISFFPQLIAGPIVHYHQLMPQFSPSHPKQLRYENMYAGFSLFIIGLAKKVVLADALASYADLCFSAAYASHELTFFEGWIAVLAYTFQIYFDFSGYSDMAIGLARMFGVRLPINFNSPYKAVNIIDFWRRWHITLSLFLRDYIYIPLGGNRKGNIRRFFNLMITMLIGGLWHGASWGFVIWGGIHGGLLALNHFWNGLCYLLKLNGIRQKVFYIYMARVVTFFIVAMTWVFFRVQNIVVCKRIFKSLFGLYGFAMPSDSFLTMIKNRITDFLRIVYGIDQQGFATPMIFLATLFILAWCLPNSQQIIRYKVRWTGPKFLNALIWKPTFVYLMHAVILAQICFICMSDFNFKPFEYFVF